MSTPIESNATDWSIATETNFENGLPNWLEPGYGWGRTSSNHDGEVKDANISVDNSKLRLEATNPNGGPPYHVGAVHSLGNFEFGPGTYLEAKVESIDLPGSLPAFWSKTQGDPSRENDSGYTYPNGWTWPPEIDFFEVVNHSGQTPNDESTHHIHYTESGEVNDGSTHADYWNGNYSFGENSSRSWHTFGCEWHEDSVTHYVDGNEVGTCSDSTVMRSLNNGAPFYLMFWLGVGHSWPGNPPSGDWSGYDTTMSVEYVRAYDYTPGSGGSGGDGTTDPQQTDAGGQPIRSDGRQYVWVRSGDGNECTLTFDAPTIELDGSVEPGYSIGDQPDGTGQRGEVVTAKTSGLPGFWTSGEGGIQAMSASSNAEVFVSDTAVDPADYPAPPEESQEPEPEPEPDTGTGTGDETGSYTQADLDAARQAGYDEGYQVGYGEGETAGWNAAKDDTIAKAQNEKR